MKLESDLCLFVFALIHLYLHPLHHVISVKRGRLVYQTISVHLPALSVNIFCSSLPPNLSSLHMLPCFSAHPVCPAPKSWLHCSETINYLVIPQLLAVTGFRPAL